MKSLASLSLLLAAAAPVQEPPAGEGPRGTSQLAAGEVRYDAVGYAAAGDMAGMSAASAKLAAGSFAEVTALDSGRTIVVTIVGGDVAPGQVATLSNGAAAALGARVDRFAIRIRKVMPTPQDVVQLRDGQSASFRAEAPQTLLVALRKKLPAMSAAASVPARPALRSAPVAKPPATPADAAPVSRPLRSGYVVQVAALSSAERAATVARATGGSVLAGPPVWRVRLGPYPDAAAAARAKADAARRGYPGGQITRIP